MSLGEADCGVEGFTLLRRGGNVSHLDTMIVSSILRSYIYTYIHSAAEKRSMILPLTAW